MQNFIELFNQFPLAWKTGTSYGWRCLGGGGQSRMDDSGLGQRIFPVKEMLISPVRKIAGPLLFDIFNSLPKIKLTWFAAGHRFARC
ncbi:MAG: hypothetical protein R3C26_11815 [Calditrichia bacterium]